MTFPPSLMPNSHSNIHCLLEYVATFITFYYLTNTIISSTLFLCDVHFFVAIGADLMSFKAVIVHTLEKRGFPKIT